MGLPINQTAYVNADVHTPDGVVEKGCLLVGPDGKVASIGAADATLPADAVVVDVSGYTILPGFIDVHVHGGGGFQMMDATYEDIDGMSRFHARNGTTSFLATTGTAPVERICAALHNAKQSMERGTDGADLLGVHLEGPYINEKRSGAQDKKTIRLPDLAELDHFVRIAGNTIRVVTLAPETEGGMEAVSWLAERGITVSIGHSDARYEEVVEAVRRGAKQTTHHFNGMRPMHHREPGLAGAGLSLPALTAEIIADGIHVHPEIVKLLFDAKGKYGVCAITDAVYPAGLPDGIYHHKKMENGEIYLLDGSSLAGSSLTMIRAFRNMIRFTGYAIKDILPAFTEVPARQIGMQQSKGALSAGKDADFLVVNRDLEIKKTVVKGRHVYDNPNL